MVPYDPTLPAGSSLGKSYEYGVDLDLGTSGSPLWQAIRRIFNVQPTMTPITQDAQTYDDKGSPNADVSAWSWVLSLSVYVNRANGVLPAELLALQERYGDAIAEAAKIGARWYHKPADGTTPDPREAFQGVGTVAIVRGNIDPTGANERWDVTITGTGPAERIENPFDRWADDDDVPTITSATPSGGAAGDLATINGSGFGGTTDVTIDATPVDAFTVISSSTIVATIPAGITAGNVPIVVTNANGASDPYVYVAG
ncbi:IPT/TIG domain-containing protein [Isoptericola halotolerans]|uniref:phage tail tube protein n=1 Tax=Isoptericola halotolerans TaxID=300560 RepID=UPI003890F26C